MSVNWPIESGEPPVSVGHAAGGVLPGLVVGASVRVAVGGGVVGATVAVRVAVGGAVVGASLVWAAVGVGVRRTVSGVHPRSATKSAIEMVLVLRISTDHP
jgi:hypothetical protein